MTSVTVNTTSDTLGLKRLGTPDNINFENNIFFQQTDNGKLASKNLSRDQSGRIQVNRTNELLNRSASSHRKTPSSSSLLSKHGLDQQTNFRLKKESSINDEPNPASKGLKLEANLKELPGRKKGGVFSGLFKFFGCCETRR